MKFPSKKVWWSVGIVLGVVWLATVVLAVGPIKQAYRSWKFNRSAHNFVNALEAAQKADYAAAMLDTYGGKTPQETLQMYIDAVEKGDYELASKYVISGNREAELKDLKDMNSDIKLEVLGFLKTMENDGEMTDTFSMKAKTKYGPYYFVRFKLYPNGIWKIIKI